MKKLKQKQFTKNPPLKVGINVKIISGKDKGKVGSIKSFLRKTNKVVVEGVNFKTKHSKPSRTGETEQIKTLEFPIHVSNVLIYEE
jgi:large subunit ribosomal protein L24